MTLTTPVAYITSLPVDPFAPEEGAVFGYFKHNDTGWILYGAGPDRDYDLDLEKDYSATARNNPLPTLIQKTYDPTNGSVSGGDIWRIKR